MSNKADRRIVRTKNEIKETFISLLEEKSFEKITVRDLTERANINRGTFYLHYLDKYDMLEKLENELFEKVQTIVNESNFTTNFKMANFESERRLFIIRILQCFQEEAAFMKVILSQNGDANFKEKIRQVFLYNFQGLLPSTFKAEQLKYPVDLLLMYISSAHLGVLTYWLQNDFQQSPEEIADMLIDIIMNGPLKAGGLDQFLE